MTLANVVAASMFAGITLYALLAGADFGAGFWDLLAGGDQRGAPTRALIEGSIGPVWEANHVWLIFVLVTLWTGFPAAFAPIMSTLYVPLTLAAVGIILRGSAFVFRKASHDRAAAAVRRRVRVVLGDHAVLPRQRGRRRRVGTRAGRHQDRRRVHQLAEPHIGAGRRDGRDRVCVPGRGVPRGRRRTPRSPRARDRLPAASARRRDRGRRGRGRGSDRAARRRARPFPRADAPRRR